MDITWGDNDTVVINDQKLDVPRDKYGFLCEQRKIEGLIMKKWTVPLFCMFIFILVGCSQTKNEHVSKLTRVDVFKVNDEEVIISDRDTIDALSHVFEQIEWKQNVKAEMSRKEDVKLVLFMETEENMPERLVEYFIWFEGNGMTTIINRSEYSLAKLDEESTNILKSNLNFE